MPLIMISMEIHSVAFTIPLDHLEQALCTVCISAGPTQRTTGLHVASSMVDKLLWNKAFQLYNFQGQQFS